MTRAPTSPSIPIRVDRKHPLAIRWMHWVNFPVLFIMIWSGLLIYWNDSDNAYRHPHAIYRIGLGKITLFRFFPEWFWKAINAPYHVTQGLGHHFFFMWIFAANGIAYVTFLAISGEWRFLIPQKRSVQDAVQVTLVDLHLRKDLPQQTKYNGAQRIAYTAVILMGFGMLLTGVAIYKPTQLHLLTTLLGGYEIARWEHFWITISFVGFFLIHVVQVVLAGWNNFRSMVSGLEIKREEDASLEAERRSWQRLMRTRRSLQIWTKLRGQTPPEPESHDPSEAKTEGVSHDVSDSDKVTKRENSENVTAVQSEVVSETGAAPPAEAVPVTPSENQAEPQTIIEEPLEQPEPTVEELNALVLADSRRHTRRSFVVAAAAAAAGYGLYNWLEHQPAIEMQPRSYRKAFETNAGISRTVFNERALTPTYPLAQAEDLRVNGVYGLKKMLDPASYRLQLVGSTASVSDTRYSQDVTSWEYVYIDEKTVEDQGHDTKTPPPSARTSEKMSPASMVEHEKQRESRSGRMPRGKEEAGQSRSTLAQLTPGLLLTMGDILRLPRYELVTQFKCIEGWSQIVHWAGIRMADFLQAYPPALIEGKDPKYVYMETPDGDYYTGYDLHVCRHPQTLLVTEMMGAPLTQYHGAPLRLHMPTKYGYKQIKRIGLISYTNSRPDDYWAKLGYDWYAGL